MKTFTARRAWGALLMRTKRYTSFRQVSANDVQDAKNKKLGGAKPPGFWNRSWVLVKFLWFWQKWG